MSVEIFYFHQLAIIKTCPTPSCPPGFTIKQVPRNTTTSKTTAMFQQSPDKYTQANKHYNTTTSAYSSLSKPKHIEKIRDDECIEFKCIPEKPKPTDPMVPAKPIKCPKEECPRGYDVVLDNDIQSMVAGKCAKFTCEPQLQEDAVCNITGRTFNTFDGTEFKYDICNHVLARDLIYESWIISSKIIYLSNYTIFNMLLFYCLQLLKTAASAVLSAIKRLLFVIVWSIRPFVYSQI